MLNCLEHREEKDNNQCMCGRREPCGLKLVNNGWYCQLCAMRIQDTEARLQGWATPAMSKEQFLPDWKGPTTAPPPSYPTSSYGIAKSMGNKP